jgi:hypothetical protein
VFARAELELWPAFQAVASRGGYDAVTAAKQWIGVARAMPGRDLSTATSASFSMRVAYERALFAFERSEVAKALRERDPFPPGAAVAAEVLPELERRGEDVLLTWGIEDKWYGAAPPAGPCRGATT